MAPISALWPEPDVAATVSGEVVLIISRGGVAAASRLANCLLSVDVVVMANV